MELRSDIATAASRTTSEYDVDREIRQLGAYLREGETVQRLATGIYGAGAGLLAVTNHRVLLLRDGRGGQASEGFPLGRLSSAEWMPDGARATISVSDSNSTGVLRQVAIEDARAVVELIHALTEGLAPPRQDGGSHVLRLPEATTAMRQPEYATNRDQSDHHRGLNGFRGDGFLPGGRTVNGAGGPSNGSPVIDESSARGMPEPATTTTSTFNRPAHSGPGWTGVRGIPEPAGPGDSVHGAVPISTTAAVPLAPLPQVTQTGRLAQVPHQQGPPERSGPLGLVGVLVGEVPITQLAAESFGSVEARTETAPAPKATELSGTGLAPPSGWAANAGTPVRDLDAGSAATGAVIADPGSTVNGLRPTEGTAERNPANITAEGTERPKPINWQAPAGDRVNPLRGPKAHRRDDEVEPEEVEDEPAAVTELKPGARPSRWTWLTAGAVALVGLAAIGSIKLLGTHTPDVVAITPVSPVPAVAVDTPTGPVVKVSKVLAGDRVEVTGQYTGTVVVLGIVSPSGTSCGAAQSKQYAVDTLNHQTVTLLADPTQPASDSSGRRLAYLELPNKLDYSTQAVGAGMAKYFDSGRPVQNATQIKAAQSVAQEDNDGLWGPPCNGKFTSSGSSTASAGSTGTDGSTDPSSSASTSKTGTTKPKPSHSTQSSTGHTSTSGN
jgi:endonuclease YncB( thermonuclease family)